jgi:hypothetical protein
MAEIKTNAFLPQRHKGTNFFNFLKFALAKSKDEVNKLPAKARLFVPARRSASPRRVFVAINSTYVNGSKIATQGLFPLD